MPVEVLVTFYCRNGNAERLALAAAVGAVQSRATIRLRRLAESLSDPASNEDWLRMRREYVAPTEADLKRAQALIFVAPSGFATNDPEWQSCLALLKRLANEGLLRGKVACAIGEESKAQDLLSAALTECGLSLPVTETDPTAQGRRIASLASTLAGQ